MFSSATKEETAYNAKGERNASNSNLPATQHSLRESAYEAGRKAKQYLSDACDTVSHTSENVTAEIRRKPVQSSVVALGIGFLLGSLLRR